MSRQSVANALAKSGISHGTLGTSKSLKCTTSDHSGSRLPQRTFERSYAGFLFHSAAQAYALAKATGLPLLFEGNDFIHTDIRPAIPC
jgi:hypothetical protein